MVHGDDAPGDPARDGALVTPRETALLGMGLFISVSLLLGAIRLAELVTP